MSQIFMKKHRQSGCRAPVAISDRFFLCVNYGYDLFVLILFRFPQLAIISLISLSIEDVCRRQIDTADE